MEKIIKLLILLLLPIYLPAQGLLTEGGLKSDLSTATLTYGRVNAITDLANVTYTNANNGVKIPFTNIIYGEGVTFSGTDGIIPSVAGRYRATWLMQASSNEFTGNGYFVVMQGGTFLGRVLFDMMESAGVNQSFATIDFNAIAGVPVELRYQTTATSDAVTWQVGSYFQIDQLPTAVATIVNSVAEFAEVPITNGVTSSGTAFADLSTNQEFTVPSAGTWRIGYQVSTQSGVAGTVHSFRLVNVTGGNTVVPRSTRMTVGNEGNAQNASIGASMTVTTTGPTTFKLQCAGGSGICTVVNSTAALQGSSFFTYEKIAGFLPTAERQERLGKVQGGEVGAGTTATVSGDFASCTKVSPFLSNRSDFTVAFSVAMPSSSYLVFITPSSQGTLVDDNEIRVPVVVASSLSTTGFQFSVEELSGATQNIEYHIFIKQM